MNGFLTFLGKELTEIRKTFAGEVLLGEDLMEVK